MTTIPEQQHGFKSDTITERVFDTSEAAHDFFLIAKKRLIQVNNWKDYAGKLSASFQLCDATGDEVLRNVEPGDYLKINIPGPGSETGDGYDWVKVEQVNEDGGDSYERIYMVVRPASNPLNANPDIAHFFEESATSTFLLIRNDNKLSAEVHGRNEIPNTGAEAIPDKIRNAVMATAAATGFSKLQWKLLTEGLLQDD